MRYLLATIFAVLLTSLSANALTLKKGEVIGGDGKIYEGASPEQKENLIAAAKRSSWLGEGKKSGVQGSNLWLVVEDDIVFVPLNDIRGKGKDDVVEVVKSAITRKMVNLIKKALTEIALILRSLVMSKHNLLQMKLRA